MKKLKIQRWYSSGKYDKMIMGKFYNTYFLESKHNLSEANVNYSYDIMSNMFLQQIHNEDIKTAFKDLENWHTLSLLEKANYLLIANFLKMLSVIDFSNMSFKEVSSLYENMEKISNEDNRLLKYFK